MSNVKITPEVEAILRSSTVTATSLKLPEGQLDRKLYDAVNKIIALSGGKWSRSAQAHVFPGDPLVKLGLALDTGVAIDEKKQLQAFFTPSKLAAHVVELARVSGCHVLEPSAGAGALANECIAQGAKWVDCIEINPEHRDKLIGLPKRCQIADFLTVKPEPQYQRVVMNPPFTKDQDITHVRHALKFLAPDGILVSIMGGNTTRKKFLHIIDYLEGKRFAFDFEKIDSGAFKESGTNVATIILTVRT